MEAADWGVRLGPPHDARSTGCTHVGLALDGVTGLLEVGLLRVGLHGRAGLVSGMLVGGLRNGIGEGDKERGG